MSAAPSSIAAAPPGPAATPSTRRTASCGARRRRVGTSASRRSSCSTCSAGATQSAGRGVSSGGVSRRSGAAVVVRPAGRGQRPDRRRAVALQEDGRGPARRVVGELRLLLEQDDPAAQPRPTRTPQSHRRCRHRSRRRRTAGRGRHLRPSWPARPRAARASERGIRPGPAGGSCAASPPAHGRRSRAPRGSGGSRGGRRRTVGRRSSTSSAGGDESRKPQMVKATVRSWMIGARPKSDARRSATPRQPVIASSASSPGCSCKRSRKRSARVRA